MSNQPKHEYGISVVAALAFLLLSACSGGGSGGSSQTAVSINPTFEQTPQPLPPSLTKEGQTLARVNNPATGHYFSPSADLPDDGFDGLNIEGLDTGIEIRGAENHPKIRATAEQAFLQWTRHLETSPGYVNLVVGNTSEHDCGSHHNGCYVYDRFWGSNSNIQTREGPRVFQPRASGGGEPNDDGKGAIHVNSKLVIEPWVAEDQSFLLELLTHEAGHRFDYDHPQGKDDCGGSLRGCHAPDSSGSVMSYDPDKRIYPNREDVENMGWPNGVKPVWRSESTNTYKVTRSGPSSSGITKWGVWIDHEFHIRNDSIRDIIQARGWIEGGTSINMPLTGNATYSGDFLGMDMGQDQLGALLKGDASLRYVFDTQSMSLNLHNFQVHHSNRWHPQSRSFSYDMTCDSTGCTSSEAQAKWYPNDWVGGTVSDQTNEYVGSFVAKKANQ